MRNSVEPTTLVCGILFILISLLAIPDHIQTHKNYQVVKEELVSCSAYVSHISVLEDDDGGADRYIACVTYTFQGVTYRDKAWKSMQKGDYYVGQDITITVNPHDPTMPYTYEGDYTGFIQGTLVFLLIGTGLIVLSVKLANE